MAETDQIRGLNPEEVSARLARFGLNKLKAEKPVTFISIFWEEVREPMILLLLFTGFLYSLWGKLDDALTIIVVILILVGVEVLNEYRAKKTIAALRRLSGKNPKVVRFLKKFPQTAEFLKRIEGLLVYLIPHYIREGKSYLTVAIGCTGGRHRSVALGEAIGARLAARGFDSKVVHRDVEK